MDREAEVDGHPAGRVGRKAGHDDRSDRRAGVLATPVAADELVSNLAAADFPLGSDSLLDTHDFAQTDRRKLLMYAGGRRTAATEARSARRCPGTSSSTHSTHSGGFEPSIARLDEALRCQGFLYEDALTYPGTG